MANWLMALDKRPGVQPVRVGEIWRQLFAKCVLQGAGVEATEICGNDNLCTGLKTGIDGAVYSIRTLWKANADNKELRLLLIDTVNTFNAGN